jgi:ABC-type uncharacterized transport system auxiliary subunit
MNLTRIVASLVVTLALGACASTFRSHDPAPATYSLHARPGAPTATAPLDGILVVARPTARSGLDTDRIVVTLPDRRTDAYAGARWAAPIPKLVEGLLVDGLRSAGAFHAVVDEHSAFTGRYLLQVQIIEFSADYVTVGALPVARVTLRAELGVSSERRLVGTAVGTAAVPASADRQREVTAAFESAYAQAAEQLIATVNAAAAADAVAPR